MEPINVKNIQGVLLKYYVYLEIILPVVITFVLTFFYNFIMTKLLHHALLDHPEYKEKMIRHRFTKLLNHNPLQMFNTGSNTDLIWLVLVSS